MRNYCFPGAVQASLAAAIMTSATTAGADHLYTAINMMSSELILINVETDAMIKTPLTALPGWPFAMTQHTWTTPDEKTIFISTDAVAPGDASIVVLDVESLDWAAGSVSLKVRQVVKLDSAGSPSRFPPITQVDPSQPIPAWTVPTIVQSHGPTLLPNSTFTYITHWTDNRVRGFDYQKGQLLPTDPMKFGAASMQTHGVNFNSSGTIGLGTGYFFDSNMIDIYKVNKHTGKLKLSKSVILGSKNAYAAFSHYTYWIDNRYAVTGTMQLNRTSLTPADATIIGPSIWLIDTKLEKATKIIGTATSPDDVGVYRSASDVSIANGKLYVAEEDSLDNEFGRDGFLAIYDMSDIHHPQFIKRLKPGAGLPSDFAVGHTMVRTPDERFLYLSSYYSNHIIKIDTATDQAAKIYSAADGLDVPHGEFISGAFR